MVGDVEVSALGRTELLYSKLLSADTADSQRIKERDAMTFGSSLAVLARRHNKSLERSRAG